MKYQLKIITPYIVRFSNAMTAFEEFLNKIAPLKAANKLGAILFQLPPSFTVSEFRQIEGFLDRLPTTKGYDYAIEFRHPSWQTEGPWELLKHYNIAAVMTDSPDPGLQYLSNVTVTADHALSGYMAETKVIGTITSMTKNN